MTVNIYFDKKDEKKMGFAGETGIFFRYYDSQNYYLLRLNEPDREQI
jgi:hypothetical protein